MDEYYKNHGNYGNWADPEIDALIRTHCYLDVARANGEWLTIADDPEVWSEADWAEFEKDRAEFEAYHSA